MGTGGTSELPDFFMLHFKKSERRGASSFTALVGRHGERVWIVPLRYGGATPWFAAMKTKRDLEIFNQAVPAALARSAMRVDGDWLGLALTFAEFAGVDTQAQSMQAQGKRMRAPEPTLFSGRDHAVEFSDQSCEDGFRVWIVAFNVEGRVQSVAIRKMGDEQTVRTPDAAPASRLLTGVETPDARLLRPQALPE